MPRRKKRGAGLCKKRKGYWKTKIPKPNEEEKIEERIPVEIEINKKKLNLV